MILNGQRLWGMQGGHYPPPKLRGMLPQGVAPEAPQDYIMILVFLWIPDRYVPKETEVREKKAFHIGPHLLTQACHVPGAAIPVPCLAAR